MKKLHFDIEQPQIEINGVVFDIHKSDADIFNYAFELKKKYATLDSSNPDAVIEAITEMRDYIDAVLGDGALVRIADGKPVSVTEGIEIMTAIAKAALESYDDRIKNEYD